jgi:hypothetical protein
VAALAAVTPETEGKPAKDDGERPRPVGGVKPAPALALALALASAAMAAAAAAAAASAALLSVEDPPEWVGDSAPPPPPPPPLVRACAERWP